MKPERFDVKLILCTVCRSVESGKGNITLAFWTEFLFNPLPMHAQGSYGCQKKRNASGFKNLWFGAANFHSIKGKVKKTSKVPKKDCFFRTFFKFSAFSLKISSTKPKILKPTCIPLLFTPITSLSMLG